MFSIDEYMIEHRLSLGKSIQNRKKIYLDTKYWGYLCDVFLGINIDKVFIEIYKVLIQLLNEKKIICPLSYRIYSELHNQKDPKRFTATVKLMETLSENVTIVNENECIDYELLYFLCDTTGNSSLIFTSDIFIWTKIFLLVGHDTPKLSPEISAQDKEYLLKEFFNEIWNYSLQNLIDCEKTNVNSEIRTMQESTVKTINKDKRDYEHELKSSKYVYMSEIAGVLDSYRDRIQNNFNEFIMAIDNSIEIESNNSLNDIQPMIKIIYNVFDNEKMGTYLPKFDIGAKVHSTIRWNKTQNFKTNDIDDIGHISTALPYYDYFFTENSFCTLIKSIKYDKKYSCNVASQPEEILSMLNHLYEEKENSTEEN